MNGLELELRQKLAEAENRVALWTRKRDDLLKALKGFEPESEPPTEPLIVQDGDGDLWHRVPGTDRFVLEPITRINLDYPETFGRPLDCIEERYGSYTVVYP